MASIPENPDWSPDIYQIETDDKVLGGPDGKINHVTKQLADRTAFLKQGVEGAAGAASEAGEKADQALQQMADIEAAAGSAQANAGLAQQHMEGAQAALALTVQARNEAQASAGQSSDNARLSGQAAGQATQKASEASASATAAVSAAGQAIAAKNYIQSVEVDIRAAAEAVNQNVAVSDENARRAEDAAGAAAGDAGRAETAANQAVGLVGSVAKAVLSYPTLVEAEDAAEALPDGQSVISEANRNKYSVVSGGLVFVRNYSRPVNVLDYVFKTNAADKTAAINEALVAAQGKALYFPAHPEGGVYAAQAGGLVIPSGVHIIGDCGASVIKSTGLFDAGAGAGMRLFDARNANDWSIRDVLLDLSEITNFPVAIRAMRVQDCTRYKVTNVHFKTPGAAIASMGCHGYEVLDNVVDVISTDGVAHHDGVIDQWAGSTAFKIKDNWIYGNGIPLYPILVTGTDSNNVATPSYDFEIKDNKVYDTNEVAIWVQGRSGRVYDFQVTGNLVDGVTDYHGLAISEADDFVAAENTIKRVARNGIRVFSENASYGTSACRNGVLSDNIVSDTNRAGLTGTNSEGAAIAVTGKSSGITLSANRVKAGGHTYAAFLGDNTTGIEVIGEGMTAGSAGLIYNSSPSNNIPGGGQYTPAISATANVAASTPRKLSYTRSGDLVTVSGRVEVTPTATATTTRLNLSLPIPSNFSDTNIDCSGNANTAFGLVAAIFADVSLDAATLQFQANNTSSNSLFLRFTYRIKQ